MLFENVKSDIAKANRPKGGVDAMSLLLIRPFEVIYKGERHKVVMVRTDPTGNRFYAIPTHTSTSENPEALKWIAERWIEQVIPLEPH